MAVFIGAVEKSFTSKSELISELKRLYTLSWVADSKVEYESYTGRVLNPKQAAASTRIQKRIIRLWKKHNHLLSQNELLDIANSTYNKVNK
jgi:hypothetical protein